MTTKARTLLPAMLFATSAMLLPVTHMLLSSSDARAQNDPVQQREQAMKTIGGQLRVLAPIARGQEPFDGVKVNEAASIILDNLTQAQGLFPEGSAGGRALPAIWEQPEKFTQEFEDAKAAATRLAEVGSANAEDQFADAFKAVGGSCGGCHENFRGPER